MHQFDGLTCGAGLSIALLSCNSILFKFSSDAFGKAELSFTWVPTKVSSSTMISAASISLSLNTRVSLGILCDHPWRDLELECRYDDDIISPKWNLGIRPAV